MKRHELAAMIDSAVLAPQAGNAELQQACEIARRYHLKSVCVKPCLVRAAAQQLAGSGVLPGAVVSFPHGADTTVIKVAQASQALEDGAQELDMVMNIGALRDGEAAYVAREIAAVVAASGGKCVKVILECALLDEPQKQLACRLAEEAGAHFVKTSTGFAGGGATVADVRLMRGCVSAHVGVKASGGIRTLQDALTLIEAGANRLGTSAAVTILDALPE